MRSFTFIILLLISLSCVAADTNQKKYDKNDISPYLTDITAGTISAGGLTGLEKTAITDIQTSQDIVVAIQPLASSSSNKDAFGIAITPARTTITPMDRSTYESGVLGRALGSATISYAENISKIGQANYRKSAFSVDISAYFYRDDDPVIKAQQAISDSCAVITTPMAKRGRLEEALQEAQDDLQRTKTTSEGDAKIISNEDVNKDNDKDITKKQRTIADLEDAIKEIEKQIIADSDKCIDDEIAKIPWNAPRWSFSAGTAWAKPEDTSGSKKKVGTYFSFNAMTKLGPQGAAYFLVRKVQNELDFDTFNAATEKRKNSSLFAVRLTYGSKDDNGDLKALAEVSNAKSSVPTLSNTSFKYALGIDKRLVKGIWRAFRVGRSRACDGHSLETKSLLNLNLTAAGVSKLFATK
jgi:hypothetical protein